MGQAYHIDGLMSLFRHPIGYLLKEKKNVAGGERRRFGRILISIRAVGLA